MLVSQRGIVHELSGAIGTSPVQTFEKEPPRRCRSHRAEIIRSFGGGRMRTFIALPFPATAVAGLAPVVAALPQHDWRPVAAEQRHITLRFLGEQPESLTQALVTELGPRLLHVPAFQLQCTGLGAFPAAARPEVLWAGCVGPGVPALLQVAAAVDAGLAALGLRPEERAFRPHLTLARRRREADLRRASTLAHALCAAHAGRQWGVVEVVALTVFRSELGPGGARYTPLARLPLAPLGLAGLP